jgi:phosphoglucosamine mutase
MQERVLFGTDGIRGKANVYPMTVEVALALGRGLAYLVSTGRLGLSDHGHRKRIVIGKDTRLSGYCFEQAISAGICSMGVDVMLVGPLPTPGIAFITQSMRADAGIVVSASHNAFEDNGIKIFCQGGFKLPDAIELELEHLILTKQIESIRPTGIAIGKARRIDDAVGRYIVYLKSSFPNLFTLDGMRIVLDCANGAAYRVAPQVLQELGAEVTTIGDEPDGININADVGSLYSEKAQTLVLENQADLGIALDGDADRIKVIDEKGRIVSGEIILALIAVYLKEKGLLQKNTVVTTDMSNFGLDLFLKTKGIAVERVAVGDRYVVERMRQRKLNWGGEESGHLIFFNQGTTGDGMVGALLLLALLKESQKTLSEISQIFELVPRTIRNVLVPKKIKFEKLSRSMQIIKEIEKQLAGQGRLLVRYSGTENKLRILVEGQNQTQLEEMADILTRIMQTEINQTYQVE